MDRTMGTWYVQKKKNSFFCSFLFFFCISKKKEKAAFDNEKQMSNFRFFSIKKGFLINIKNNRYMEYQCALRMDITTKVYGWHYQWVKTTKKKPTILILHRNGIFAPVFFFFHTEKYKKTWGDMGFLFLDMHGGHTIFRQEDDTYKFLGDRQWEDVKRNKKSLHLFFCFDFLVWKKEQNSSFAMFYCFLFVVYCLKIIWCWAFCIECMFCGENRCCCKKMQPLICFYNKKKIESWMDEETGVFKDCEWLLVVSPVPIV